MNTISQPSRPLYVIDVPEVNDFQAKFKYNFYMKDESINDNIQLSKFIKSKTADLITDSDASLLTRVPRYVSFNWKPITSVIKADEKNLKKFNQQLSIQKKTISENYKKIIFEDQLSSLNFCSVTLNDNDIDKKTYFIASGSFDLQMLDEKFISNNDKSQVISVVKNIFSEDDNMLDFFSNAISESELMQGIVKKKNQQHVSSANDENVEKIKNLFFEDLKKAKINFSLNTRIASSIVENAIKDPFVPFVEDFYFLNKKIKEMKQIALRTSGRGFSNSDYRPNIQFIEINKEVSSLTSDDKNHKNLIGYVIDKKEVLTDGSVKEHNPIIIENGSVCNAIDYKIKYGSNYIYSIRSIMAIQMPAINEETGEVVYVKFLVSSKSSEDILVDSTESIAPPPPADVNFTWDYSSDKLMIYWSFPTNPQRDIKKFQIFRRANVEHPFELIKELDFNDSLVVYPNLENPSANLVSKSDNPITFYIDVDFTKKSNFIYSLCSVDAHGITSNYSAQYELSFDVFKNQIIKKIISHAGAPKPYPNLYLPGKGTIDVAHVSGNSSKRLFVYFAPQCYSVTNNQNKKENVLETDVSGGYYKFNFINTDIQKNEILDIVIEDKSLLESI